MKKLLAGLLVGLLVLTGCGSKNETPETPEAPEGSTLVGTAVVATTKGEDAGDKDGKFESNVTYATVVVEDGKIKSVSIDTAQNAIAVKKDSVSFEARPTKKELGDKYGMSEKGFVEWDKQIASLEEYLVGKEVKDIKADSAASDLNSTVSITIDGYITAVNEAVKNAVAVEGLDKVGTVSTVSAKTDSEDMEIGTIVSSVALDKDGKVIYSFVDESQAKAKIADGKVVAGEENRTKGQQGKDYGMSKDGGVEWNEQIKVLTDWVVGKDAAAVAGAADESDVNSTVSIYIGSHVSALEAAIKAAK